MKNTKGFTHHGSWIFWRMPASSMMTGLNQSKARGFTLIELLVVIAIIALLSSVVLASLGTARMKARNARRYADYRQIKIALEMYYDDKGQYPSTGGGWWTACPTALSAPSAGSKALSGPGGYIPDLAPEYIATLPTEPSGCTNLGAVKGYIYYSNGTDYKFASDWFVDKADQCTPSGGFGDTPRPSPDGAGRYFCSISSPGGAPI